MIAEILVGLGPLPPIRDFGDLMETLRHRGCLAFPFLEISGCKRHDANFLF